MTEIDITGVDPAYVLKILYDNATAPGMGAVHRQLTNPPDKMDLKWAQELLDEKEERKYFDYIEGRCIKTIFFENKIRCGLYHPQEWDENLIRGLIENVRGA